MTTPSSRDRILEAAIALLDTEGEGGLKIDKVAEVAQVTKQSMYHFFGDRDGLISAAQAERYRRALATPIDVVLDRLFDCVTREQYVELLLGTASMLNTPAGIERRRFRIQALGSATTRPALQAAVRDAHRESVTSLATAIAFGQRRGWVDTTYSPTALSEWYFDMIIGRHLAEYYATDDDAVAAGLATIDSISLLLFREVFPEYSSAKLPRPDGNDAH